MNNKFTVRDIVIIGMLASLCIVATTIKIPYGTGAMVHLGSAAIFTSAILFGGVRGGMAGAIGSGLFDLIMALSPYTLWSFFIKGIAGLIVGSIAHGGHADGSSVIRNIIACILGALWTLAGYILAWTLVIGNFQVAIVNIPSSLMTSAVGILVAIPLSVALRKALIKYGIR
ncbi:MAG TPA: ECF transporter S component [Clostridia bacterium]|nr:ECF transporter S component [Clostridia bacterium]